MFSTKAQTLALSAALRGIFSAGRLRTCLGKGVVCTLSVHEKPKKTVVKSPFVSQKNANFATVQHVEPLKK